MALNVLPRFTRPEGKNTLLLTIINKAADFAKIMPGFDKESVEYYLSKAREIREENK